ncbi:hypothetical protein M3E13_02600 [Oceanobacillus kimchii]|uniref:Uncharacterized protein n=1 Tax=Oceanobacillus kimchii TaxID=746691 RepID=A0ABQ5TNU8_9BACI|nr:MULTISPECIES: hypothetical protein [Oceanobacillus]MBT2599539.1 hypothetical protein [Oceanobacillus sp. ISL-74]MCT1576725.1 hypothetical protein [Oceanobacillus kimchii]MCT2134795.1 hypothetical protein [Oceanobacillus kimchii]GLO67762.1 hypothetical protein MACH08_35460 [Oceanobacillus kimchii]
MEMKTLRAYFQSENDAVSAKSSLASVRSQHLFIDEIPTGFENEIFIPVIPYGPHWGLIQDVAIQEKDNEDNKENEQSMTHLLEAQIAEDDIEKAATIISNHNGYRLSRK